MNELPVHRRVSIELRGTGSDELDVALASLRGIVEAAGGQMFDRQITSTQEIDLMNDDDLRMAATCVDHMHAIGLLDPGKQLKDLVIGTDPPQRFWDATGYKGLNKAVLSDLAHTVEYDEKIETVPALLTLINFGRRSIADKKLALLRRALVDSGMPEEFPCPWPVKYDEHRTDRLLRSLALIAPTFEELPTATKIELARDLDPKRKYFQIGDPELPDQLKHCAAIYAERRREILAIVRGEDREGQS